IPDSITSSAIPFAAKKRPRALRRMLGGPPPPRGRDRELTRYDLGGKVTDRGCRGREEDLFARQGAFISSTRRLSSPSLGESCSHQRQRAFLPCLALHLKPFTLQLVVRHE